MMPAVPLMHATGLFNCMGALLAGGRVVTARPGRLDPGHVWQTVAAQRVRTLVVAGNAVCQPLVDELLAAEAAGRATWPRSTPTARSGSSAGGNGVINTGGEKVHPQEVEDLLLAHPGVTSAAVVGVPDKTWGERVVAVVAAPCETVTEQELKDALRPRLAGYKIPRAILLLPRSPAHPHRQARASPDPPPSLRRAARVSSGGRVR